MQSMGPLPGPQKQCRSHLGVSSFVWEVHVTAKLTEHIDLSSQEDEHNSYNWHCH